MMLKNKILGISLFSIFILELLYIFNIIDSVLIYKRIKFITIEINNYELINGEKPNNINFISQDKDYKTESVCTFFDKQVPGWGYCYFELYQKYDKYVILIRGVNSSILFDSNDKEFIPNPKRYDF